MSVVLGAIGVDPGLTGGVAYVQRWETASGNTCKLICHRKMPTRLNSCGDFGAAKKIVDGWALSDIIREWMSGKVDGNRIQTCDRFSIIIERQQAMPKQGVASVFSHGVNYGVTLAAIQRTSGLFFTVNASEWKKDMGLSSDKKVSIDMAKTMFGPKYEKNDDGRAEAALLAVWRISRYVATSGQMK